MAAASAWGKAWGAAFGAAWGASPLRRHRTRRQREHSDLLLIFKP